MKARCPRCDGAEVSLRGDFLYCHTCGSGVQVPVCVECGALSMGRRWARRLPDGGRQLRNYCADCLARLRSGGRLEPTPIERAVRERELGETIENLRRIERELR